MQLFISEEVGACLATWKSYPDNQWNFEKTWDHFGVCFCSGNLAFDTLTFDTVKIIGSRCCFYFLICQTRCKWERLASDEPVVFDAKYNLNFEFWILPNQKDWWWWPLTSTNLFEPGPSWVNALGHHLTITF